MELKKYMTPHYIGLAVIFILLSVYMVWKPINIKGEIVSTYRDNLAKATADHKLNKTEIKEVEEKLSHVEKGQLFSLQNHDTSDFIHTDYFGEPWRQWASTFMIWEKARNYFFVFLFLLVTSPFLNKIVDAINIFNLRLKGIKVEDYN